MAYSRVYVIGDSLVDSGNALGLGLWFGSLPFTDVPDGVPLASLGYYDGRFTDGPTFADLISNKYLGIYTEPTFPFRYEDPDFGIPIAPFEPDPVGDSLNFAYGGAQVIQGDEAVLDLSGQVDAFQDAIDGNVPAGSLVIVTLGGNDIRSLAPHDGPPVSQADAYAHLEDVAQEIIDQIDQLLDDGATDFLLSGIADVGIIPRYDADGNGGLDATEQARVDAATDYSLYLDMLIRTVVIPELESRGANIEYAPLTSSPGNLGTLEAILPTLNALNGYAPGTIESDFIAYQDDIFFDLIHPTAQVHALAGAYMYSLLEGTPWIETLPLTGADIDASLVGEISAVGEVDSISIALAAGTTYTFEMLGISSLGITGSIADPLLALNGAGASYGDDDSGAGFDANLTVEIGASGTYSLELSGVGAATGGYVLQVAMVGGLAMAQGNTYVISDASTLVIEGAGGLGQDVVQTSTSYALLAGSEIELLETTNARGKSAIDLTGNEFDQTLAGNRGNNVLDGNGGSDTYVGGAGNDIFVLDGDGIDHITDFGRGDLIDVTALLDVSGGTDLVAGGYLRIESGMIQIDADGGADGWTDVATINGNSGTFLYLENGALAQASVGTGGGGKGGKGGNGGGGKGGPKNSSLTFSLATAGLLASMADAEHALSISHEDDAPVSSSVSEISLDSYEESAKSTAIESKVALPSPDEPSQAEIPQAATLPQAHELAHGIDLPLAAIGQDGPTFASGTEFAPVAPLGADAAMPVFAAAPLIAEAAPAELAAVLHDAVVAEGEIVLPISTGDAAPLAELAAILPDIGANAMLPVTADMIMLQPDAAPLA